MDGRRDATYPVCLLLDLEPVYKTPVRILALGAQRLAVLLRALNHEERESHCAGRPDEFQEEARIEGAGDAREGKGERRRQEVRLGESVDGPEDHQRDAPAERAEEEGIEDGGGEEADGRAVDGLRQDERQLLQHLVGPGAGRRLSVGGNLLLSRLGYTEHDPSLIPPAVSQPLADAEQEEVGREVDGLFVQSRAVGQKVGDKVEAGLLGEGPSVDEAEHDGREGVGEDGLDRHHGEAMLGKGLEARLGGAQADMVVGDSEEEDWRAAPEEEEGGADARGAYWEPRPQDSGVC